MEGRGGYPLEVGERAVRLVVEQQGGYDSQREASVSVAEKIGCSGEMLRMWVRAAERQGDPGAASVDAERERIRALERENREFRRANEILQKAAAFFAQAELDRQR